MIDPTIDIKKHFISFIDGLNALIPHCHAVNIVTDHLNSGDEWEDLVQSVFRSFVLLPIEDLSTEISSIRFHKLGYLDNKSDMYL